MYAHSSRGRSHKVTKVSKLSILSRKLPCFLKGKGKARPRTGHEGPDGEQTHSSTLPSTSVLDGWVVNATFRPLYPRGRPGTHCRALYHTLILLILAQNNSRPHRDIASGDRCSIINSVSTLSSYHTGNILP